MLLLEHDILSINARNHRFLALIVICHPSNEGWHINKFNITCHYQEMSSNPIPDALYTKFIEKFNTFVRSHTYDEVSDLLNSIVDECVNNIGKVPEDKANNQARILRSTVFVEEAKKGLIKGWVDTIRNENDEDKKATLKKLVRYNLINIYSLNAKLTKLLKPVNASPTVSLPNSNSLPSNTIMEPLPAKNPLSLYNTYAPRKNLLRSGGTRKHKKRSKKTRRGKRRSH
jgi:hypothetical protein